MFDEMFSTEEFPNCCGFSVIFCMTPWSHNDKAEGDDIIVDEYKEHLYYNGDYGKPQKFPSRKKMISEYWKEYEECFLSSLGNVGNYGTLIALSDDQMKKFPRVKSIIKRHGFKVLTRQIYNQNHKSYNTIFIRDPNDSKSLPKVRL